MRYSLSCKRRAETYSSDVLLSDPDLKFLDEHQEKRTIGPQICEEIS